MENIGSNAVVDIMMSVSENASDISSVPSENFRAISVDTNAIGFGNGDDGTNAGRYLGNAAIVVTGANVNAIAIGENGEVGANGASVSAVGVGNGDDGTNADGYLGNVIGANGANVSAVAVGVGNGATPIYLADTVSTRSRKRNRNQLTPEQTKLKAKFQKIKRETIGTDHSVSATSKIQQAYHNNDQYYGFVRDTWFYILGKFHKGIINKLKKPSLTKEVTVTVEFPHSCYLARFLEATKRGELLQPTPVRAPQSAIFVVRMTKENFETDFFGEQVILFRRISEHDNRVVEVFGYVTLSFNFNNKKLSIKFLSRCFDRDANRPVGTCHFVNQMNYLNYFTDK